MENSYIFHVPLAADRQAETPENSWFVDRFSGWFWTGLAPSERKKQLNWASPSSDMYGQFSGPDPSLALEQKYLVKVDLTSGNAE